MFSVGQKVLINTEEKYGKELVYDLGHDPIAVILSINEEDRWPFRARVGFVGNTENFLDTHFEAKEILSLNIRPIEDIW